jgi:hypothetical protein
MLDSLQEGVYFNGFREVKMLKNSKGEYEFYKGLKIVPVIYIFVSKEPIKRLVGESPILKIGQTKNFKNRMKTYFSVLDLNSIIDNSKRQTAYHLRNYLDNKAKSEIKLYFKECITEKLKDEEKELLKVYLDKHYEVPPLNMGLS